MAETDFILSVTLMILLGIYLCRQCYRSWKTNGADSILVIVIYANFVWALLPAIVAIATNQFDFFTFGYPLTVWSRGLHLDVVFFSVFAIALRLMSTPRAIEKWAENLRDTPSPVKFLSCILFFGTCFYLLMIGPWTGVGYEGAGRYILDDLSSTDVTIGGAQVTIYRCVLVPALCVLLFYASRKRLSKWFFLGATAFAYVVVDSTASGARGKVLEVFFAAGICLLAAGHRKKALAYILGASAFIFIFSGAFLTFRGTAEQYAGDSALTKSQSILQAYNNDTQSPDTTLWLATFLIRLDSVQNAGILAQETAKSATFATYRPFVGSLLAWLPRYAWPRKPLPLSTDGTVAGLPWYLVMSYRDEPWNNGSVSVSGVAYWQFGWPGVIVSALAGAALFRTLSTIAARGGIVGVFLLLVFSMMTHFRIPVGMDESLLVILQLIIPVLAFRSMYVYFVSPGSVRQPAAT